MTHNTAKYQSSFWHFTLSPHHYVSLCIHGSHFSVCVSHFWFFFSFSNCSHKGQVACAQRWPRERGSRSWSIVAVPLMATTPKKLLGVLTWAGRELRFPVKFKYMALTDMDFFIWPTMPIHFFPSPYLFMNLIYVSDPCHHAFVFVERAQLYWNFVFEDFYKYLWIVDVGIVTDWTMMINVWITASKHHCVQARDGQ